MDFARVLGMMQGFLEGERIPHALVGGLGLAAYGLARTTFDIDLVVDGDREDEIVAFLEAAGYETLHRSAGYSNHLHPDLALGRVDLVYVRGVTRDAVFREARSFPGPKAKPVLVPRPEHLAAMKIVAMKSDPGRIFAELADIRFLLGLPGVNREEIKGYFLKHNLGERYRELEATL